MKSPILIALGSFLVAAIAIKAAPALAEPIPQPTVSVVHTADLNLSSEAGRRVLDRRLVVAAREVCGEASDVDLAGKNIVRQCRKDVLDDARSKSERLANRENGSILIAARR